MSENLQKTDATTALAAIDDLVSAAGAGTENIGQNDVRPAQLKLCQAGSPQRKTDDPKQIKGLQELDLFNDLSEHIYGRKMTLVIFHMLGHRNVEFKPGELGTVLDRDVPDGDPRTVWPVDEQGQSLVYQDGPNKGRKMKPAATKFYSYLAWVPETAEIVVLNFSSTQTPVAIKLNGLLKLPLKIENQIIGRPPVWARILELSTFMDKEGELSWGAFAVKQAGITDRETRDLCASLYDMYKTKKVEVEYSDPVAEAQATEFPYGENVQEGQTTEM